MGLMSSASPAPADGKAPGQVTTPGQVMTPGHGTAYGTGTTPGPTGEVRAGLTTALPAAVAIACTGATFGVLVIQSGLPWWWAPLCQAVVFAGSLEFVLVGLAVATAPLGTVALTAVLVNSRHVFYSLSFPLDRVHGRLARLYSIHTLTDEAYALTATPGARTWSGTRILTIQATLQVSWVAGGLVGVGLGSLLPPEVPGLGFAFTALFVVLAMDAHRATGSLPFPLVAATCATGAAVWAPHNMLLVGMIAYVCVLLFARGALRLRARRPGDGRVDEGGRRVGQGSVDEGGDALPDEVDCNDEADSDAAPDGVTTDRADGRDVGQHGHGERARNV